MSERLLLALEAVVERLATLMAQDGQLRVGLRQLAQAILEAIPAEETAAASAETAPPPAPPSPPPAPPPPPTLSLADLPPLRIGSQVSEVSSPWAEAERYASLLPVSDADLDLIEERCRAKAQGARWAVMRQRKMREGADFQAEIQPKDREIIEQAKRLSDCFLWMNHPGNPPPGDLALLEDVAACFDMVADAIAVQRRIGENPESERGLFEQSLDLLAEAQSSLRAAIERINGPRDNDQQQVFLWLRRVASEHKVFIHRYMRANDPADPAAWRDLASRIETLDHQAQGNRSQEKERRGRIKKVCYHAQQIAAGRGGDHDWNMVIDKVDEMVRDGIPPSNREIRDALLPIVDSLPDRDVPENFQLVLREIDRYLSSRAPNGNGAAASPVLDREVQQVAELLRGRSLVLIGGDRRNFAYQTLKTLFGLNDLVWVETREHQSLTTFEPHVARDDVVAVVLAIRWSSHSYGEVKDFCERYGKPLVRLPAGYGVNQVAHQLLQQCGNRLRESAAPDG